MQRDRKCWIHCYNPLFEAGTRISFLAIYYGLFIVTEKAILRCQHFLLEIQF